MLGYPALWPDTVRVPPLRVVGPPGMFEGPVGRVPAEIAPGPAAPGRSPFPAPPAADRSVGRPAPAPMPPVPCGWLLLLSKGRPLFGPGPPIDAFIECRPEFVGPP